MTISDNDLQELGFSIRGNGDETYRAYRAEGGQLAVIMHRGSHSDAIAKIKEVVGYSSKLRARALALGLNDIAA